LRISQSSVQDFRLGLRLENGALTISPFSYRGARGNVDGSLELHPANNVYELVATVAVNDALFIAPDSDDTDAAMRPPVDGRIDIRGSGDSLHAIMASSNGRVSLRQGPGQVRNRGSRLFGDIATQVIRTINPLATESEYRRFDCGIYDVTIVDGIATFDEFAFQTDKLTTVASGTITFQDEKLDVAIRAKPREGIGISIGGLANSFVKIGGTLKSPQLILDTKGAAATTGAAVMTGGLSLLGKGLLDRLSAAADMCKSSEREQATQESDN